MRTNHLLFLLAVAWSILYPNNLNSSESASKRHIAILVRPNYRGEISFAFRIKSACENIHWDADVLLIRHFKDLKKSSYDFVINLVPGTYKHPKCKNYLAIFDPEHHYFDDNGFLKKKYRSYDGYLLTYSPSSCGLGKKSFANQRRSPYMLWYPSVQKREFKTIDPSHLFYICCAWGNRFKDENFQQCLNLLDKERYMRFYGSSKFQSLYPQSYQGAIPHDDESLYDIASEAGVSLVLHSSIHNTYGLPSGRIFELAAASSVIICDQNPFVMQHFGDSVLYIDTNEDGPSIHRQIQQHMEWIRINKNKALEKAKKAYLINKEKFSLEDQLLRLAEFHDQLSNESKHFGWKWLERIGLSDML